MLLFIIFVGKLQLFAAPAF